MEEMASNNVLYFYHYLAHYLREGKPNLIFHYVIMLNITMNLNIVLALTIKV